MAALRYVLVALLATFVAAAVLPAWMIATLLLIIPIGAVIIHRSSKPKRDSWAPPSPSDRRD